MRDGLDYHISMADTTNKALLPAYLVAGDDALKREAVLRRMRTRLEKLGDLSFNSDTFDGEHAEGSAIATACQTLPFASEKRLVVVSNAEKLKKTDAEEVVAYLAAPAETTVLLLLAEKLAKNTRLYKAVASLGASAVIDCARPKRWDMAQHVRNMAPSHGVTITEGAAALLVELLGEDTVRLDNELKKIALAQPPNDAITEGDVKRLVMREAEAKPWDLADALASRDLKQVMAVIGKMPSASPFSLLGICISRIRELICVRAVLARGGNKAQAAGELKVPDWKIKNHDRWVRNYSAEELRQALTSAVRCERDMKSGTDASAALRDWLIGVVAP